MSPLILLIMGDILLTGQVLVLPILGHVLVMVHEVEELSIMGDILLTGQVLVLPILGHVLVMVHEVEELSIMGDILLTGQVLITVADLAVNVL
jgi:hypothetical protein